MAITISTPTLYTLTGNKNEITVTTSTTGVTAHFLHLKIDVFLSDGVTTIDSFTDKLPVINGKATFEIQEFLRQKQTENFTELIVNSKEHDLVVSYTLSAFETYDYSNTEQNTIIDPTLYFAIQGKIESDYELRLETLASTFYADWLKANKFLTNKPRTLNQLTSERLKLYYLAFATESVDLICDIVFEDASISSITIETISMNENKIYELLVGFTELKLAAQETTSKIASYKIYLQATSWTSEVFEITIERDYYPNQHQFIFRNAFGVYDTILLRGIEENNKSYENVFGSINNKQLSVSKIATNNFSTASRILPYSIKSWIWEFSNSLDAYSIVSDIIYSIIIKNENDVSIVDNSFLYGHVVKYEQIKAVKQIVEYVPKIVIDISITDYTTQSTGITLLFTGNVKGKYDDGSEFDFVSDTENIRNYTSNGNYRLIIYGDLANITNVDFTNANIVNTLDLRLTGLTGQEFGLSQNKITELNIENLNVTQINQDLPGVYGLSSDIQKIYAKNTKLSRLWNDNNTWTNLDYLDLTNVTTLIRLYLSATKLSDVVGFNTLINLEQLRIENMTTWASKTLDISNFNKLSEFYTTNTDFSNGITGLNQTTNLQNINFKNSNIGGILDLSQNSNVTSGDSQFLNGNNFTEIVLNNSKFLYLNGVYDTLQGSDNLTKLHIQNNTNLDRVSTKNKTLLTDVNLTGSRLFRAYFDGCALTQISIDNVIQTAVNGGVQNGALTLQGGTNAAPSTAGEANIDILRSKGWTVTVKGGY